MIQMTCTPDEKQEVGLEFTAGSIMEVTVEQDTAEAHPNCCGRCGCAHCHRRVATAVVNKQLLDTKWSNAEQSG